MYIVYVLYSSSYEKIYINTTNDLENQLITHNASSANGHIGRFRPWELFYFEEFETEEEALSREKKLKAPKGRQFIWNMIRNRPRLM